MIVAIVGSRGYRHLERVRAYVATLPPGTVVVSGGAAGVDREAARTARARGLAVREILPNYAKYPGKLAPMIRNRDIIWAADHIEAFWDYQEDKPGMDSRGTANAVALGVLYGKTVHVNHDDTPAAMNCGRQRCFGCGVDANEFPEMDHAEEDCPGPECTRYEIIRGHQMGCALYGRRPCS